MQQMVDTQSLIMRVSEETTFAMGNITYKILQAENTTSTSSLTPEIKGLIILTSLFPPNIFIFASRSRTHFRF